MPQPSLLPRMIAALLALLGLLDAAYLSIERLTGGALACPIGGGCEVVQGSTYALLLGVPVAFVGVAGYARCSPWRCARCTPSSWPVCRSRRCCWGSPAPACSSRPTWSILQVAVIGAICFWCMVSATLELGIWAAALYDWRQRRGDAIPVPAHTGRA